MKKNGQTGANSKKGNVLGIRKNRFFQHEFVYRTQKKTAMKKKRLSTPNWQNKRTIYSDCVAKTAENILMERFGWNAKISPEYTSTLLFPANENFSLSLSLSVRLITQAHVCSNNNPVTDSHAP